MPTAIAALVQQLVQRSPHRQRWELGALLDVLYGQEPRLRGQVRRAALRDGTLYLKLRDGLLAHELQLSKAMRLRALGETLAAAGQPRKLVMDMHFS